MQKMSPKAYSGSDDYLKRLDVLAEKVKGKVGVVTASLRLSGSIDIDGKSIPARSLSGFIDVGQKVEATGIDGSEVTVKRI